MQPMIKLLSDNRHKGSFRAEVEKDSTTLYLYDAIVGTDAEAEYWGGVSAETLVKTIRGIKSPVINLRVNSPGGDVFAGRAIEQALRDSPATVTAYVDGYAASAASFLVMAADRLVIAKGGFLMIHKAWTIAVGNSEDLKAQAALLDKIDGTLAETYAARSGMDVEGVLEMMAAETWFTADEAVAAKLADEVAADAPKAAAATWNMSAYGKAPPAAATPTTPEAPPPENDNHTIDNLRRRLRIAARTA